LDEFLFENDPLDKLNMIGWVTTFLLYLITNSTLKCQNYGQHDHKIFPFKKGFKKNIKDEVEQIV